MKTEEVAEKTQELIELLCSPETAKKMMDVLNELSTQYFTAPASSKKDYHNCFAGGLAEHNLNVLNALLRLNDEFGFEFDTETMCVVALFHDIGKCVNSDMDDYYVPSNERWKQERGEVYDRKSGSVYLINSHRTIWLLQKLGFNLNAEQFQAILVSDGMFVERNKAYKEDLSKLSKILHIADMIACIKEKENQDKTS